MNIVFISYCDNNRALTINLSEPKDFCSDSENIYNFNNGTCFDETMSKFILTKIHLFDKMIDRIWVLGGEPLDQDIGCLSYLFEMLTRTGKEIWLFTRYELRDVPECILAKCSYVKSGRYDENLKDEKIMFGITLASSNQTIYKRGYDY